MSEKKPPIWALRTLQFFCKERYLEQIEGDLFELFERDYSRRKFVWNTLRFFRLRYLKGIDDFEQLTTLAMLKNYFKVAIRSLIKQRSFASINIIGLAIGLAACLLISMYVFHERSYDNFYPEADRIYRVANGESGRWTPALLAETMMNDYPNVEVATKISGLWESLFQIGDRTFLQDGTAYADANVFKIFDTPFIAGSKENALTEPNTIVLTQSLAEKCFPGENAMGKAITIEGKTVKVTGIVPDPPRNTHFPYKMLIANPTDYSVRNYWTGNNYWTYAKIQEGATSTDVNQQLFDLYERYVGAEILEFTQYDSFEAFVADNPGRTYGYTLHPLRDIHLEKSHFSMGDRGDKDHVWIFSIVALFILLVACVNYINMSTARIDVRSKEVGIRKAMGSHRNNIIMQFLVESMLITLVAIVTALIIAGSGLNLFNELTGRQFVWSDLFTPLSLLSSATLLVLVGLVAGVYPSYVVSGLSAVRALKGQISPSGKGGVRKGLVIFQFAISVFLIAVSFGILRQVDFMQSQDLGIDIKRTIAIENGGMLNDKYEVFKSQVLQLSEIGSVSKASNLPFHGFPDYNYTLAEDETKRTSPLTGFVAPGFEDVLGLELVAGRFFDPNLQQDTAAAIINQSLALELGWENPIGKKLKRDSEITIVGVVKDFNFTSLKRVIDPLILRYGYKNSEVKMGHQFYIVANLQTEDIFNSINKLEEIWNEHVSDYPFEVTLLTDSYQKHYESEIKFGQVFGVFSGLAILIAGLGLFALTTFVLQKRYKEIAVRKVLGATIPSILRLVILDFSKIVLFGGFIGVVLAFYWLTDWLQEYPYRFPLKWYLMAIPLVIIIVITWIIVTAKSYRAAAANPALALKDE